MIDKPSESENDEQLGRDMRALVNLSPGEDVLIRFTINQGFEVRTGHGWQRTVEPSLDFAVSEALRKKLGGRHAH